MNPNQDTPVTRKELQESLAEMRSFVLALITAGGEGEAERMKGLLEGVGMSWEGFGAWNRRREESRCGRCESKRAREEWEGEGESEEDGEREEDESSESGSFEAESSSSSIWSPSSSISSAPSYPPPIATHFASSLVTPSQPSIVGLAAPTVPATTFLSHVSHPHGSLVVPGASFVKTWKLKNTSNFALHPHSALRFLSGTALHSCLPLKHVGPVEPGETFEVSVAMKAPLEEGRWKAVWVLDDLEEEGLEEGVRGRCEVELWIITGSPSSTYFPSPLFPQIEPTSSLPPQPHSDSPPSSPQIYPAQAQLQVRYDHLSHSVSTIDLSASVDWSESGWDDGCTGDVEVDEGVEDLLMDRGEEWTEVRWFGEGR
ncbi:hypothetical protein BDY24DRAFT_398160 [Mrakia frigida]|uniref:uncharacterized protein n=1 Tax=Mrakia frigida TaxID=29902 RepID=UPI003FCBF48C